MSRKRIVLVCMVDSIHVARWIAQFDPAEVEFILFPSTPNRHIHSLIRGMIAENQNIKVVPFRGLFSIPLWGADLIFSDYIRGFLLRMVLRREQPDFVHALELQHGGYITSRALEDVKIKTKFMATNYGSDIFWFQQFPKHLAKIKRLLARATHYSAECNRDVELAKKYGFEGQIMPVFPNAGGFDEEILKQKMVPAAGRDTILVKGYEGWVGKALNAVAALQLLGTEIADYKLVFYSCNKQTLRAVKALREVLPNHIEAHRIGALSHTEMIALFQKSRVYLGLSLSDGISTSALEALAFGAFPVQTSTSCLDEWFTKGAQGTLLETAEPKAVADAVLQALLPNMELDRIIASNREFAIAHLGHRKITGMVKSFYL